MELGAVSEKVGLVITAFLSEPVSLYRIFLQRVFMRFVITFVDRTLLIAA